MKTLTDQITKIFSNIAALPENVRSAIVTKMTESVADQITKEIVNLLEDQGLDVNLTINLHIKKH